MDSELALIALLGSLREETQRRASLYAGNLATLGASNKSLLYQAFCGGP